MAHLQNPATPKRDTPFDPAFTLRVAASAISTALAALDRGDTGATAEYAVVAAQWLGEAHRDLTAVEMVR
ncbi:hypothetical protein [Mycobacteroides chelonae]|uniref:hypothetical protein n=1 Tax=Mycobacteroides chelonae TaxID=1774 RepID=UPI0018B07272|nr:hypothetical protein [Mycobacteroides chelonae]MBF9519517.1 hypothetical protein [Mycobacteroides chelonae]